MMSVSGPTNLLFHIRRNRRAPAMIAIAIVAMVLSISDEASGQPVNQPDSPPGTTPAAPTARALEQAKQLFVGGKALFDNKDYEGAVVMFEAAYRLAKKPLLLYNVGYTYDELGDFERALFFYEKFLADADPRVAVYQEVKQLTEQLRAKGVIARPSDPPYSTAGTELVHNPIEKAPPGMPLDITVAIPRNSNWQVWLFYRSNDQARFTQIAMRPRYSDLVGRIPAIETGGDGVHYYLEAQDNERTVVARSGESISPHQILIDREARPSYYADLDGQPGFEPGPSWNALTVDSTRSGDPTRPGPAGNAGSGSAPSDRDGSRRAWGFEAAKWGASAGTVVFVGSFVALYRAAANEAESLENEGAASATECRVPPCRAFSEFQKDRQQRGQRFETLARVSLGLGIASAGVAAYLWYVDIGRGDQANRMAVPVVGKQYVGAAAAWSF